MNFNIIDLRNEIVKAADIYKNWKSYKFLYSRYAYIIPFLVIIIWIYFFPAYKQEIYILISILYAVIAYKHGELSGYIDGYWDGITKDAISNEIE